MLKRPGVAAGPSLSVQPYYITHKSLKEVACYTGRAYYRSTPCCTNNVWCENREGAAYSPQNTEHSVGALLAVLRRNNAHKA